MLIFLFLNMNKLSHFIQNYSKTIFEYIFLAISHYITQKYSKIILEYDYLAIFAGTTQKYSYPPYLLSILLYIIRRHIGIYMTYVQCPQPCARLRIRDFFHIYILNAWTSLALLRLEAMTSALWLVHMAYHDGTSKYSCDAHKDRVLQ